MCRGADQMRVFEQFQQTCINGVDVDELLAIARSASCGFESCQAHKMADPTASDGVYPITSADGTSCERERADSLGLAWLGFLSIILNLLSSEPRCCSFQQTWRSAI